MAHNEKENRGFIQIYAIRLGLNPVGSHCRGFGGGHRLHVQYRAVKHEGMVVETIDSSDGRITGDGCPNAQRMPFIEGSQPRRSTNCSPKKTGIRDWFQSLFGD